LRGVQQVIDGVLDGEDPSAGLVGADVVEFGADGVDDSARARDVVRHPDDVALVQQVGDIGGGELVVGRPDHGTAAQLRHGLPGQDGAEGRRDQDVHVRGEDVVGRPPDRAELVADLPFAGVDVRQCEGGAFFGEEAGEAGADAAQSDHGELAAVQTRAAVQPSADGPQRGERPQRGVRGRVAAAAQMCRPTEHMGDGFADHCHVVGAGPDIRSGGVCPAERVDDVCHVPQHVVASADRQFHSLRQGHDGFAATAGQARDGELRGHRGREAKGIGKPVPPVGVVPDPEAAGCRAEGRGVNSHDHRKPRAPTGADRDLLMIEQVSAAPSFVRCGEVMLHERCIERGHDRTSE
jgi:hypothetical protein